MLRLLERSREQQVGVPSLRSTDYINTIPPAARAVVPRRRARRAPDPRLHPLERRDHGAPRAAARDRRRRAHLLLRVVRVAVRGRLQPLLPRQGPPRRRRPDLVPGPRLPRHLRPRLPRGPADRAPARRVPPGGQPPRRRAVVLPAPAADAGLLGVPHRLDGPGPAQRDLPGAVQPLPARPRHQGHLRPARLGVPRRRRDGRARVARRDRPGRPRGARQPHLRHQLQPAAPRRPGPRQRQDHPGDGVVLPRRRLERHQGDLGPRVGRAAGRRPRRRPGQPDEPDAGRRLPDLQGRGRRLRPRALLRPRPAHPQARRGHERQGDLGPLPRRPRLPQGLRGVQGGPGAQGPADGHPRQDHQGLDAGQPLRGPQLHAPDEEADRRGPGRVPRPALPATSPTRRWTRPCRPTTSRSRGSDELRVHARAAPAARWRRPAPAVGVQAAQGPGRQGARHPQEGVGQAGGGDDDGVRPPAQGAAQGQGARPALRADHPGRGAHLRPGRPVLVAQDLQPGRPALHLGRPRADAGLQGVRVGRDPARGHQRGRLHGVVHRRRHAPTPRTASR